jgi:hypothetical protein
VIAKLNSAIVDAVIVVVEADGPMVSIYLIQRVTFLQMNGIAFARVLTISGLLIVVLIMVVGDEDFQMAVAAVVREVDIIISGGDTGRRVAFVEQQPQQGEQSNQDIIQDNGGRGGHAGTQFGGWRYQQPRGPGRA